MITYEIDEIGGRAIPLADGRRPLQQILECLAIPDLAPMDLAAFFQGLIDDKIFRDAASDSKVEFPPNYEARLKRQLVYFSGLAPAGQTARDLQHRLLRSRVLIVGAGGGGSHMAVQLAGVGVGNLTIADHDRVEIGNLGRQIFYADHIGELKVEVLRSVIGKISPETSVTTHVERLTREAGWINKILPNVDLVINCADYPSMDETSRWLFDACYPLRIPLIPAGGYNGHMTSVPPTLIPGRSTCWHCYERTTAKKVSPFGELRLAEMKSGVFLPATVAMAALQMPEIIRVLTGCEQPRFINCRGEFDINACALRIENVPPTPGCGTCEGTA
ncbi:MAG: hypothetical protein A2X37_06215 [Elusimicrobia bacterium GWA2_66_18]|nr:MAG: hypothetical protein A2X37_06215 [Elusimicrobia bacterium GWA2_66_18]